jgi:hypothetical protein
MIVTGTNLIAGTVTDATAYRFAGADAFTGTNGIAGADINGVAGTVAAARQSGGVAGDDDFIFIILDKHAFHTGLNELVAVHDNADFRLGQL